MELFKSLLLILLAVVTSRVLSQWIRVPMSLLQIGCGIALASVLNLGGLLDPALLLLIFVAPLLFIDAYWAPRSEFLKQGWNILSLVLGLVVVTVVVAGYFLHWLVPVLSLPLSFALASVLSPTDAVALSGSIRSSKMPGPLLRLLEGEALLNDASGLVCFRFAVMAALSGAVSLWQVGLVFLEMSLGGILVGVVLALIVSSAERLMQRKATPQPASQILLGLLLPFVAYLVAEHMQFSGILAVVAAGFTASAAVRNELAVQIRVQGNAVFTTLQAVLNGFIFVLLGSQLPEISKMLPRVARESGLSSAWSMLAIVLAITAVLISIRFLWALSTVRPRDSRDTGVPQPKLYRLHCMAVFSVAGVRGALTLAAIFSLPLFKAHGIPLAGRELAIVLAAGIICASLLLASTLLPLLLRGLDAESPSSAMEESAVRAYTSSAAIRRLNAVAQQHALHPEGPLLAQVSEHLINLYQLQGEPAPRKESFEPTPCFEEVWSMYQSLTRVAVTAEQLALRELADHDQITDDLRQHVAMGLDYQEASLSSQRSE